MSETTCVKKYDLWCEVTENRKITQHLYVIRFRSKELAEAMIPGHFLQLALDTSTDPLLRRPYTAYRVLDDQIEILYEVVGKGTGLLTQKKPGDTIKILGPLGNIFSTDPERINIAIGGGIGIAPFMFLSQKVTVHHFLMGAREKEGLLPQDEAGELWNRRGYATNDGSEGKKGFVTECLTEVLENLEDVKKAYLYVCGPKVMTRAIIDIAEKYGIEGEASVDERMGCGFGACLGCVVKTKDGYRTSCKDGTVFKLSELDL